MSPATRASQVPSHAGFANDIAAHLAHGLVVSTPVYFVMARKVRRDAAPLDLLNPWTTYQQPDSWMVWLAAGDLRAAMRDLWPVFGEGKVWLAFQRHGPAVFVRAGKLSNLYGQGQQRFKQQEGDQTAAAVHVTEPQGQPAH